MNDKELSYQEIVEKKIIKSLNAIGYNMSLKIHFYFLLPINGKEWFVFRENFGLTVFDGFAYFGMP